ncbi:uncharacterized protein LOC135334107 [Halichondria panicea]|uniref:uncharacterized protein LOC135334107 n=1 Tax=Halichondria panicea TaxID=6063 RepID=UPI00312B68F7
MGVLTSLCSLLSLLLVVSVAIEGKSVLSSSLDYEYDDLSIPNADNNTVKKNLSLDCVFELTPCSITITGNLILVLFYGALLAGAAKMISDGAELLLDLGLPAAIIGGVVLPLLGAIPDSVMIVFSGMSGDREEANTQIAVGMGTLAGSTIMLLTLPWLGSLILARVDLVHGQGVDERTSKFTIKSFWKQGVSFQPDVTYGAIIMLITTIPYFVVQGADWHWGPSTTPNMTNSTSGQPDYIKNSSLATCIMATIFLIAFLVFQVLFSVGSRRKDQLRREETIKRRVLKRFYVNSIQAFTTKKSTTPASSAVQKADEATDGQDDETQPILPATTQRKYAKTWQMHRANKEAVKEETDAETHKPENKEDVHEEKEDPKWLILIKSLFFLIFGVVMVTVFSDPMVNVLTALTDKTNAEYQNEEGSKFGQYIPIPVFYVSFVVTPICSNASEIISSLIFAAKRKKTTTSMTYAQLYGAATMNNTLGLAVFAGLIYFRDLDWQFSAEVTVILLIEFAVGIIAIAAGFGFKHTYVFFLGLIVGGLYFFSILLIFLLETYAKWK